MSLNKKNIIPNIFHVIYDEKKNNIYQYFNIESIFKLNNPEKIFVYYLNDINHDFQSMFYKDSIIFEKINKDDYLTNEIFIFKKLKEFGGIYADINILFISNIFHLLKYNFFKTDNNTFIGSEKDSYMINKYLEFYLLNYHKLKDNNLILTKDFNEKFGIRNINGEFINNYLIPENMFYLSNTLFLEISDYSFSEYFNIIQKYSVVYLNDYTFLENTDEKFLLYDIFNKYRTYNLLIKHILGYSYLYNRSNYINKENFDLINNIDIIFWINLDRSLDRKENMLNLLKNFNIPNYRISAVDGELVKDVDTKYFNNISSISNNNRKNIFSNKEFATLLSHLNAIDMYRNFNNLEYNIALICEDDLALDFINYWKKSISDIVNNAPKDWDIIMLGYFSLKINYKEEYPKWNGEWSAISYLINHNAAEKLCELKIDKKWVYNDCDSMVADSFIFSKLNTYLYKYPYMTFPNNNYSTIHEDHINYHYMYKNANYLTLENVYEEYIS
jgi:hypothetical protein